MRRLFPLLLLALAGTTACGDDPNDVDCEFYGFDYLSRLDRPFRIWFEDTSYGQAELTGTEPVEVYSEQVCGGGDLHPDDLPTLYGAYMDGAEEEYLVDLPPEAWTGQRLDQGRGYPFYRAEIIEDYLVPR